MADSSVDPVRNSSRRTFLAVAGVGAAAVGTAAVLPASSASAASPSASSGPTHDGPLIAHVTDVRTGAISVYAGEGEVVVHDRDLARRLAAVAARAK